MDREANLIVTGTPPAFSPHRTVRDRFEPSSGRTQPRTNLPLVKALFHLSRFRMGAALIYVLWAGSARLPAATTTLLGWSDVGMHEMDDQDMSVYSLMPPYSTIHAQLMSGGLLVTNPAGFTVTYQAIADAKGSINSTSQGKGNFYQYAQALFGQSLKADQGLAGFSMPGSANRPQAMVFDASQNSFTAQGIPITPYDDQGRKNRFPLMRLVARDGLGTVLATTDIVLPVTDEMDCRACHASGSQTTARPPEGWAWEVDPIRDYKLNVLRSHDDHLLGTSDYTQTLSEAGYNRAGLVATVTQDGKPVSCVLCHASGALPGSGLPGGRPLTQLMHTKHSYVSDPRSGSALNILTNTAGCLLCHAGPENVVLRGVHHNTIRPDGALAMQCQSCHGSMTAVGSLARKGWVDEPACQSCHTGTATSNRGSIRYTSVFDGTGNVRLATDLTFGTPTNSQTGGFGLFQHSLGHGGLDCAVCHGSTHAEVVSLQANENVQSQHAQGQAGVLASCNTCHPTRPLGSAGGPHGLHPVDSQWASSHETTRSACQVCHGTDYRGTVLSRAQADRTYSAFGTQHFWSGFQVGCYTCHAGPNSGDGGGTNSNIAPATSSLTANATAGAPVTITLQSFDANGNALAYQFITQPVHGTVSLNGNVATYFPGPAYIGTDSFTYAAWDGSTDSNLGTVSLTVSAGQCALATSALAPTAAFPKWPVPFRAAAVLSACSGSISYDWDFGDGTPHGSGTNVSHVYPVAADYTWTVTARSGTAASTISGNVTISPTLGPPLTLTLIPLGFMVELSWPADAVPTSLETAIDLGQPFCWQPDVDPIFSDGSNNIVYVLVTTDQQSFRLRRLP